MPRARTTLALAWLFLAGCGTADSSDFDASSASIVYGTDDRVEVYAHPDAALAAIATQSTLALIPTFRLQRRDDGTYSIFADTLGDARNLCLNEPFGDQPIAAVCSAALIDDDLILTAGHCLESQRDCERFAYVFDYHMSGPEEPESIEDDDVYQCARIVVREKAEDGANTPDFAIVQLDRAVAPPRTPVRVRSGSAPLERGEPVTMIGVGSGLPTKIDMGGAVADPRADRFDYFVVNTDAFAGHSGAATLDANDELAGILVAGQLPDYVREPGQPCQVVNVLPDEDAGEIIHYVAPIVDALCESGWPSETLCGSDSCTEPPCPPVEWFCNTAWFAAGDSCDCNCGAYDPDCDDPLLAVGGCSDGVACDLDGKCDSKSTNGFTEGNGCSVSRSTDPSKSALLYLVAVLGVLLFRRVNPRSL